MPKQKPQTKPTLTIAIIVLLINLILPGIGSIIGKKPKEGIWQIVLFIIGIPLILIFLGIVLIFTAWIWGIVTGIKLIAESQNGKNK
ncbi:hypothetical protein HOD75_03905 [archaeon]|jgi:TM2 domain-containing membrane protein YozV|nr:hypothetical protein [archaeon]MBT4242014.1 hypothetical protein [archaeon]MBT4418561.1 hypothetical protein [archaeon]